jgi:hypothetical protein
MMHDHSALRILFPTSFSDPCFRTARAISQLADTLHISLTITHVVTPGANVRAKRRELNSFMAEADHYDSCSRVLIESENPIQAIAGVCEQGSYDLVLAPASDRLGLQRLVTSSFRARLLKNCCSPMWTAGSCLDYADFKGGVRNIACLVDFENDAPGYLPMVVAFASRIGARLRILHVIRPVDEGTLTRAMHSRAPLMPEVAMERVHNIFAGVDCPEVDVAIGSVGSQLPRMLRRAEASLLFVGAGQALRTPFLPRLARHLDRLPCPVICMDGASTHFSNWSFQLETGAAAAVANGRGNRGTGSDWAIAS